MSDVQIGQPISGDKLKKCEFSSGRVTRKGVLVGEYWVGDLPNGTMFMLEKSKADEEEARALWQRCCDEMRKSIT